MRWVTPYLALLLFPLSVFLPFNWVRFVWGFQNGLAPMTQEVKSMAERVDLFVWPLRDATIVCLVVLLVRELDSRASFRAQPAMISKSGTWPARKCLISFEIDRANPLILRGIPISPHFPSYSNTG
jgi:hypothetical protein